MKHLGKHLDKIAIFIVVLLIGGILGYINIVKPAIGAPGSQFQIETEYVGDTDRSGLTSTTTTTSVASTSPIFFTANSTSTVTVLTAGVTDFRLNIIAHATTTAEGAGPEITVETSILGKNGIDSYFDTVLSTSGVTKTAALISTYYWNAKATTTRTTTLSPDASNFSSASIQITDFNAPKAVLKIGSTAEADISVEIVKVIPN